MITFGSSSFRVEPFSSGSKAWNILKRNDPIAGLYHSTPWISLIRRAFGLELFLATVERNSRVRVGCVLARSRNIFKRKLIALPFSDACPPLAVDKSEVPALMSALSLRLQSPNYEVRGSGGYDGWETVDCFQQWNIELSHTKPSYLSKLSSTGRRKIRRAREQAVEVLSGNRPELLERYYALHARTRHRLGVPSQGRALFTLMQRSFPKDALEIWLATHKGIDVSGLITLRHRDEIHYKWGARLLAAPNGTQHLLISEVVGKYAGHLTTFDLGRTDKTNAGLVQFKRQVGGISAPLPYAFYPRAPRHVSAEAPTGTLRAFSTVWKSLPSIVVDDLGELIYPYLS